MENEEIVESVREIMGADVDVSEFGGVPHVKNVGDGDHSLKFPACVLSIDLRASTAILNEHYRSTAVKIYKAFHEATCRVVEKRDGRVRSFDGDGILALWYAPSREDIRQATMAAIEMKDLLRGKAGAAIQRYREVDFGIGLDHGEVHAAKVGPRILFRHSGSRMVGSRRHLRRKTIEYREGASVPVGVGQDLSEPGGGMEIRGPRGDSFPGEHVERNVGRVPRQGLHRPPARGQISAC